LRVTSLVVLREYARRRTEETAEKADEAGPRYSRVMTAL
jgi:hypothetical protein